MDQETPVRADERDHSTRDWFAGIAIAAALFFLTAAALGWLAP